jgi:type IV pilus assembly protein PilQ
MRNLQRVVSTGCFFLCLGGWVCSDQARGEDPAGPAKEALIQAAVGQAAVGEAATPREGALVAAAAEPPATAEPAAPAASQPKPGSDVTKPEISVGADNKLKFLSFPGTDVNSALSLLADQFKRNIIASRNVKGGVTVTLYDVTFDQALEAMGNSNGFKFIVKGNFVYIYTDQEYADQIKATHKTLNQIFHLKYMTAKDVADLIKPLLSSDGQIAMTPGALSGLASGTSDLGSMNYATDDTLVIRDYPENLANINTALKDLDVRPKQVLIEATILNASLKDNNGLGIDLVSLSGLNFSDIGSVISPMSGSATTGGDSGTTSASNVTTPGQTTGTLIPGVSGKQLNAGTNFAKDVPSGGLSIGFLSNHISFFMRALETVTDTTVVANPKILALNKQKGEVHIGQRLGFITTSYSQSQSIQTVNFLDVGTKLVFRPYIADDGNIRMEIHPEDSSGIIDAHGVPQTNTTEVTANVMIKDGRTIVIGGLFSENTSANKGQVPVLGNIPILGLPFRSQNDATIRQETIILITPHIINDDDSLYKESLRESEDVTRMMMGNRAGLQPWGRDRIAQLWLSKAEDAATANNSEKALMYADWALNTNPRLLEAMRLRERLSGKKLEEATSSSIMDLVKNTLRSDAAITPNKGGSGVYPPETPKPFPVDKK